MKINTHTFNLLGSIFNDQMGNWGLVQNEGLIPSLEIGTRPQFAPTIWRGVYVANAECGSDKILATLFLDSPRINNERTSKSSETDGSPASILATLD